MRKTYIAPLVTCTSIDCLSMICSSPYSFDPSTINAKGVDITEGNAEDAASRSFDWDD